MNTKIKTNILNNGLTVKYIKNDYLHSANIGIYARKLPEKICGIAHMTEHMIFRRLSDVPQQQLYFATDKIGATLKGTTYTDFICIDITVSQTKLREAFELISKVFDDFKWLSQEVNAEKRVVRRQIEDRYNSLYSRADREYYSGTPKGCPIMGNISDLNRMSTKSINNYRENVFAPNNCCVVLTGNFNDSDLSYFTEKLKQIPADNTKSGLAFAEYAVKDFSDRSAESDKIYNSNDGFSDVCISFDVDGRQVNRYAAEILHSIIGFGVTSKLSQVLRERLGFISELSGNIEFSEYAGRMTFEFDTACENLKQSLKAAFEVIAKAKRKLTKEDMQSSIVFYTDNQYRLLDDVRELNFLIGWRDFIEGERIDSIDELSERYKSVTVNEINEASSKIFSSKNLVITVSNDNKKHSKDELFSVCKVLRKEL